MSDADAPFTDEALVPRRHGPPGPRRLCVFVPIAGLMGFVVEDAGDGEASLGECWIENDGNTLETRRDPGWTGREFERICAKAIEAAQAAMDERRRAARERVAP